ncbi:hypothetical protein QTP88_020433 [Uroleucon formosanum]
MDGKCTNDVIMAEGDATIEFSAIPLMLEFEEPETVNSTTENNELVEMEPEPQREPIEVLALSPAVSTDTTAITAIRLGSGADDNPTTATGDVEDENVDRRARRTRSRSRRSRRGRGRRSRSRRSRSRRSQSRRSRSRRNRRSRSRSDDSDFSVQIADDEISAELAAGNSRGGRNTSRGGRRAKELAITGHRGGKATRDSHVSAKAIRGTRGGQKSTRGSRRDRKTVESVAARTIWSERLRPLSSYRNKKSKAK